MLTAESIIDFVGQLWGQASQIGRVRFAGTSKLSKPGPIAPHYVIEGVQINGAKMPEIERLLGEKAFLSPPRILIETGAAGASLPFFFQAELNKRESS